MQKYKLSRSKHNKLFPARQIGCGFRYSYEVDVNGLSFYKHTTWITKVLYLVCAPMLIIWYGLPAYMHCLKDVLSPSYKFDADFVTRDSETFDNFILLAKEIRN